jgi:hypothetical protein
MATLPIEQALAYLDTLETDRKAALALSEQKAEEAKLIQARQEGFRAALDILCGETSAGAGRVLRNEEGRWAIVLTKTNGHAATAGNPTGA